MTNPAPHDQRDRGIFVSRTQAHMPPPGNLGSQRPLGLGAAPVRKLPSFSGLAKTARVTRGVLLGGTVIALAGIMFLLPIGGDVAPEESASSPASIAKMVPLPGTEAPETQAAPSPQAALAPQSTPGAAAPMIDDQDLAAMTQDILRKLGAGGDPSTGTEPTQAEVIEMTTGALAGIAAARALNSDGVSLADLVLQAMRDGAGDAYVIAMVEAAVRAGKIHVPVSLRTTDGGVDTPVLLATLAAYQDPQDALTYLTQVREAALTPSIVDTVDAISEMSASRGTAATAARSDTQPRVIRLPQASEGPRRETPPIRSAAAPRQSTVPAQRPLVVQVNRPSVKPGVYTVQPGDSLAGIALFYYGDSMKYREIFAANNDVLGDANVIKVGQKLRLP